MNMDYRPLIIIGAPRSGTNLLRDALTQFAGVATWPCDEINYIWRHYNVVYPSDAFAPEMARLPVRRYIRGWFDWVARHYTADTVVEKTCANSLRLGFVNRVLPEAKYVFIRRNGFDAVASAIKRWQAGLEPGYILRKARFVPPSDLVFYAARYMINRLYRQVSRQRRLAFWGPRIDGMDKLLRTHPLDEVCAFQWRACVDAAGQFFARLPSDRWLPLTYEALVSDPETELQRVLDFAGVNQDIAACRHIIAEISPENLGQGRQILEQEAAARLTPIIADTMSRYGCK
ncbi:MAG: sulfotransferase family protein [Thermodesulfobacteriota bacterium]